MLGNSMLEAVCSRCCGSDAQRKPVVNGRRG